MSWDEMRWTEMIWDTRIWAAMKWDELRWHEMSWDEMRWTEMTWDKRIWAAMKWDELRWGEMSRDDMRALTSFESSGTETGWRNRLQRPRSQLRQVAKYRVGSDVRWTSMWMPQMVTESRLLQSSGQRVWKDLLWQHCCADCGDCDECGTTAECQMSQRWRSAEGVGTLWA